MLNLRCNSNLFAFYLGISSVHVRWKLYSEGFDGVMWFLQVNGLALPSNQRKVLLMHHTFSFLLLIVFRR
jgi:hypothetical protein